MYASNKSTKLTFVFLSIDTVGDAVSVSTLGIFAVVAVPTPGAATWVDHDVELVPRAKVVNSALMGLDDVVSDTSHTIPTVVGSVLTSQL